jgi:diguanylate cyclase (GGDEF)-like protein/PAS domain S-box-containing protein
VHYATNLNHILNQVLSLHKSIRFEETLSSSTGTILGDIIITPILDSNGVCTHILGIGKDMTEGRKNQEELIQMKALHESFFKSTVAAIDVHDLSNRILDVNPAFEVIYGYKREEVLGKELSMIVPKDGVDSKKIFDLVVNGGSINDMEAVRRRKDGSMIEVSLSLSPLRNAEGKITSVAAITRDISERKIAEKKLMESEERYRLIAENMTDLVLLLDPKRKVLYASPSYQTVLGFQPPEGALLNTEQIFQEDRPMVIKSFENIVKSRQSNTVEYRFQHGLGHFVWLETNRTPVLDEKGELNGVLCVSREITKRKQQEAELERMAFYDYLTGALNRRVFMDRLRQQIVLSKRTKESFAVMFLDIDRFKWVNDTLGHDVGDELLVQLVKRVKTCIREMDMLARLGGDEFAILLPKISSIVDVSEVAKRILAMLQEPWKIRDHEFITTSSIGISQYPFCGEDTSTLLKNADEALYKAKQLGRNNYQFCKHLIDKANSNMGGIRTNRLCQSES